MNIDENLLEQAYVLKEVENHTVKEIMDLLGLQHINYDFFRNKIYRYSLKKKKGIEYLDNKIEADEDDVKSYYEQLKKMEEATDVLDTKQTSVSLKIDSDKPICVAFWGDWHLGSRGLDYEQFDIDRESIKKTEGLYFIGMGDYKDNNSALVTKSTNENMISQSMQDLLVTNMMGEVGSKCIALVRGCHDDWDKKIGDRDFISELCKITDSVNLWHGGMVHIGVGDEKYSIFARHKYKNESSLNTTNAQRNMINDIGACDVAALGHKHFPDMQMLDRMKQKVVYLRSGSYKKYDEFGQKIGGYSGKKSVPCVILFPNTHKVVPFQEIEDAIIYLNAVRK
jgi:predicted phosphodiesterase